MGKNTKDVIEIQGNASEDPENQVTNIVDYGTPTPEIAPVVPGANERIVIVTEHHRDVVGQAITIAVTAENGAQLSLVKAFLDEMPILDESLPNKPLTYRKSLRQMGSASPGMTHKLRVVAYSDKGHMESVEDSWDDNI